MLIFLRAKLCLHSAKLVSLGFSAISEEGMESTNSGKRCLTFGTYKNLQLPIFELQQLNTCSEMLLILKVYQSLKDGSVLLQFAFTQQNPRLYIIFTLRSPYVRVCDAIHFRRER